MFGFQCLFVLKNTKNTKFKEQEEFSKNTISQEEFSKTGTEKALIQLPYKLVSLC